MGLKPDAIVDAFWEATEDLPENAIAPTYLLQLLAGICERLNQIEPSERLQDEVAECRESAELNEQLVSGDQVRLGYCYSAYGDGFVELSTVNAEVTEADESGTVVGTPGATIRFDEHEARRAIHILATLFPSAKVNAPP